MNKILVTGGTGFIGRFTCRALEREGYQPVVLDRQRNRGPLEKQFDTVLGDVRDAVGMESIVGTVDGVIHLAGMLGTQETVSHPRPAAETNMLGTLSVLAATRAYDLPMVYISVGNHWMNNSYSISKSAAERFCLMYRAELDAKVSVVRALNAYGPGQKTKPVRKIVPTFINAALDGEPLEVYGDGTQIMDMVYVADVANILVRTLEVLPDHVVEAGTGRRTTVNDIAQMVIDTVGSGDIEHIPMRPGEDERSVVLADTETLEPLGIGPAGLVTLEEGLSATAQFYMAGDRKVAA